MYTRSVGQTGDRKPETMAPLVQSRTQIAIARTGAIWTQRCVCVPRVSPALVSQVQALSEGRTCESDLS